MMGAFTGMLRRDLLLAYRNAGELLTPLLFFVMVAVLFPLGLSPDRSLLAEIAPGVIWTAALLASLLGLDHLFRRDRDDGVLEQIALSPEPLGVLVLAKVLAHWLVTGLPLVVLSPVLASMLAFPSDGWATLAVGLALGTPVLSLLGAVGAALTVGLRGGGMLVAVLILPLAIPVLIFGARAAALAGAGEPAGGALYLLGALLLGAISLLPFAIGQAVRIGVE